jgi:hypothetical protein
MPDGTIISEMLHADDSVNQATAVRGTSKIQFPYFDLDEAISVARVMRDAGGNALFSRDQLAAALKHPSNSGAFSAKLQAAKLFGLTEYVGGKIRVTQLGFDILDTERARSARVEAFLTVPLYRRAYEEYRGKTLPARPHGLERAFVDLGVLPKRGQNARWAFERSARQAGFFDRGEDRLVAPIVNEQTEATTEAPSASSPIAPPSQPTKRENVVSQRHLLIDGLLETLPEPYTNWALGERVRWLGAAANIFDVLFSSDDEGDVEIKVIFRNRESLRGQGSLTVSAEVRNASEK